MTKPTGTNTDKVKASVFLSPAEHEACLVAAKRERVSLSVYIANLIRKKFRISAEKSAA